MAPFCDWCMALALLIHTVRMITAQKGLFERVKALTHQRHERLCMGLRVDKHSSGGCREDILSKQIRCRFQFIF